MAGQPEGCPVLAFYVNIGIVEMSYISLFIFIFIFFVSEPYCADADLSNVYDENTEITVSGAVIEIVAQKRGPVILKLMPARRIYHVVTAPPWFLREHQVVFRSGTLIEVKGSKYFSRDGNIYIISREIRNPETGRRIILRDLHSKPVWGGHGMHRKDP